MRFIAAPFVLIIWLLGSAFLLVVGLLTWRWQYVPIRMVWDKLREADAAMEAEPQCACPPLRSFLHLGHDPLCPLAPRQDDPA